MDRTILVGILGVSLLILTACQAMIGKTTGQTMEGGQSQRIEAIKGEVLRIEGDTYVVKGEDGKEVRFHTDDTTHKTGNINQGDRIEAQMNDQNYALSIRSTPTTDRRNEKSESMLAQ